MPEDEISALLKAAGADVEPSWPALFAEAPANVNMGSLICRVGPVDLPLQPVLRQQEVLPLHCCCPS